MLAFTCKDYTLSAGIELLQRGYSNPYLVLGDESVLEVKIPLYLLNPPQIQTTQRQHYVFDTNPVVLEKDGQKTLAFARSRNDQDKRCLVRVTTHLFFDDLGGESNIVALKGELQQLAFGKLSFEIVAGVVYVCDALIIMKPGEVIKITFSELISQSEEDPRSEVREHVLIYSDLTLICAPLADYEVMLASSAEWL